MRTGSAGTSEIARWSRDIRDAASYFNQSFTKSESGCWLFDHIDPTHGYGAFSIGNRKVYAHRFSYELHHGPIPAGAVVRHSCDNPPCCNPAHLQIGTQRDNAIDRETRGRGLRRFTSEEEEAIRERYANGEAQRAIARDLGVSGPLIWKVVNRQHLL